MTRASLITLILITLLNLAMIAGFELAHDEAYYWIFSNNLAFGYFDHPPMVAIIIRAFSWLPQSEWSVRIGFVLLQSLAIGILTAQFPKKDQIWGQLAIWSMPLLSTIGLLALPDLPLFFFSVMYFWCLKKYLEFDTLKHQVLLSLVIAALLYSKYHGILLVFFTLLAIPSLLKKRSFYVVTILSILLFLPHVIWQYDHDFKTLRYHFLERPKAKFSWGRIGEYFGLQIIFAGLWIGFWPWWKTIQIKTHNHFERALKFSALGVIIFFFISSFSKRIEANWTLPAFVALVWLVFTKVELTKKVKLGFATAAFLTVFVRLVFALPMMEGKLKRLKEFNGWAEWSLLVQDKCGEQRILANTYQIASKLSFYLGEEVPALNYHSRKNQFDFWDWQKRMPESVCYLTDASDLTGEEILTPEAKSLKLIRNIPLSELVVKKQNEMD